MLFSDILLLSYFLVIVHAIKFRGVLTAWQNDCLFKKKKKHRHTKKLQSKGATEKLRRDTLVVKSGRSSQLKIFMRACKEVYFVVKLLGNFLSCKF